MMKSSVSIYKYSAGLAFINGGLLLIPLVAMQFTDEVVWNLGDFVIAGILIFGTGFVYKLVTMNANNIPYKAATGLALLSGFLLIWVNLAVGIIGPENNPANLMYFGVILIGIIGAIIARFRPTGMARTLFATASAQVLVPVMALIFWPFEAISWAPGVFRVFMLNTFFVALFVVSALLFRHVALEKRNDKIINI